MSFELTDEEGEEVRALVDKKLKGIKWVLESGKKGAAIRGKDRLEARVILMEELLNRLNDKYVEG